MAMIFEVVLRWTSKEQELFGYFSERSCGIQGSASLQLMNFPRWQVCHPFQGEVIPIFSIHCFLCSLGETAVLKQICYITAICTTLHKFLVVISTNISIQQSFSSCIQLMVGELFSSSVLWPMNVLSCNNGRFLFLSSPNPTSQAWASPGGSAAVPIACRNMSDGAKSWVGDTHEPFPYGCNEGSWH